MKALMVEVGTEYVLKNILTTRKVGPPMLPKGKYGTGFNPDMTHSLPSWLSEDDLAYYVSNDLVEKKINDDEFDCTTKSLSTGYVGHGGDFLSQLMVHEEDDGVSETRLGSLMMVIVV
ncbi:hypothetical protein V8G54_014732 [Vigna mungo]|uniref:Uncharacterized protein n=1 Tax=Vigna mungo TaxID=3915 RepID=A0AAQ3RXR0_VIGMU